MISFLEGKIEYFGDKYVILNTGGIGYKVIVSPKLLNILSKSSPAVNPALENRLLSAKNKATQDDNLKKNTENTEIPDGSSLDSVLKSGVNTVKLFVHSQLNMREGTFDMYGFQNKEDLELFHLVTSVNGIGPKSAIGILSTIEPKHLKAAIMNDDADYLKKVSGLGPKTAQRLILELKNKVDYLDMGDMVGIDLGQEGQAMEALLTLGYSPTQAKEALKEAKGEKLETRVRDALRLLGKK